MGSRQSQVPYRLAGCIIGRKGATVRSLQKRADVTIKLSRPSELYPGTCDRVALLIGERAGIAQAAHDIALILETVSVGGDRTMFSMFALGHVLAFLLRRVKTSTGRRTGACYRKML